MKGNADLIAYYERLLQKHGDGPLAVDWNTEEAQDLLFVALLEGLDEQQLWQGARVLDIGCGLGALYRFLCSMGYNVEYVGYDISPGMIESARKMHPDASFEVRDILSNPPAEQSFDIVFLSGSISILLPDHERYVRKIITRMYHAARKVVAFNLLSKFSYSEGRTFQNDTLRYHPAPEEIVSFCRTLTPILNLRHDAASWTFTMQLFRQGGGRPAVVSRFEAYAKRFSAPETRLGKLVNCYMEIDDLQSCHTLFDEEPESAELLNFRSVCYSREGKFEKERQTLETLLKKYPEHVYGNLNMGTSYFRAGKIELAEEYYRKALALSPNNETVNEQLFYVLLHSKQYDKAQAMLQEFENKALAKFLAGELCRVQHDYTRGIEAYKLAIADSLHFADAYLRVAQLCEQIFDYEQAAQNYEAYLQLIPSQGYVQKRLAEIYFAKARYEEVIDLLELVVFDCDADYLRAKALWKIGKQDAALMAFDEALAEQVQHMPSLISKCHVLLESDSKSEARQLWAKIRALPESATNKWQQEIDILDSLFRQ